MAYVTLCITFSGIFYLQNIIKEHRVSGDLDSLDYTLACERRRISGCHLVPPKNNVCEPEPENDFREVGILSQSQFSSNNPRTTARGIRCEEHSSFILSWNRISQGETKVITSQKSFPGSGSQTLFFGGTR